MKQNTGFLVLNMNGKEEKKYFYPHVLYQRAVRVRLKKELGDGKILCCCCTDKGAEVTINDHYQIQFLKGNHTLECMKYIQKLAEYSSETCIKPFLHGNGYALPVAFRCRKGARREVSIYSGEVLSVNKVKQLSLKELTSIISARAFDVCMQEDMMTAAAVLSQMEYEFGMYKYVDPDGNLVPIHSSHMLHYRTGTGELAFFCGKVLRIHEEYGSMVYLNCENDYGSFSLSVSRKKWESVSGGILNRKKTVLCISGFVQVKEVISYKKGHYDKITKTISAAKQDIKCVLELTHFTLFHLNQYGLIVGSGDDLLKTCELITQGKRIVKPYYPVPGCDLIPKYYVF